MEQLTINGIDDLKTRIGQDLGTSDWLEVTQADIDAFADATGDHQWIHVDPERAKETPFGGTIAHGLYTLSIGPKLTGDLFTVTGIAFALNYGYNKVRFPSPLPSGSKLRMVATLTSVDDVAGGVQMVITQTFEREGGDKPVCVAESVVRMYAA
jgi:acyl dehydratase